MKYCPQCTTPLHPKTIDGIERLACTSPNCNFVVWDNPIPVVAALVQYRDQFLLARNAQWPPGMFSFITGYLERGESPEVAVVREVGEELGLAAEVKSFIGHYPFLPKNQLILAYAVQARGELRLGDEITEVRLLKREELVSYDFGPFALTATIVNDGLAVWS
jgi:NAD+ diphosphatase